MIALPLLTSLSSGRPHDRAACIQPHLPALTYFSSPLTSAERPARISTGDESCKNYATGSISNLFAMAGQVVALVLLFAALSGESRAFASASDGGADGAMAALFHRVAKRAPGVRVRVIPVRARTWFGFARERDTEARESTTTSSPSTATDRSTQKIRARRRLHAVSDGDCKAVAVATTSFLLTLPRRLGPASNGPGKPLAVVRPVKFFILCAHRRLRKPGTVGISVASSPSPIRAVPANEHLVPLGNNHRRALKQLQVPPLPFTVPQVLFSPPTVPQLRIPPLPFTGVSVPPLILPPLPPLPFTSTPALPSVSPKQVSLPPLPIQIPLPCEPSSSGKSLPAP